ncbi:hypothetical protein AYX15_07127 [Cryptococcus neoformans]|nr:hypothetical protein AYX15_07127 [Cryptococcus neoformans var. grubii]
MHYIALGRREEEDGDWQESRGKVISKERCTILASTHKVLR